jgi:1,4-alpha-glucan branching enzyme
MNTVRAGNMLRDGPSAHPYRSSDISSTTKEVVVLKQQACGAVGSLKVTFVLDAAEHERPVSVLGSFNGWNALTHPLKKRSNGTRSVTVEVPVGNVFQFKDLGDGGQWFCDPDADAVEVAEYAVHNSVLQT